LAFLDIFGAWDPSLAVVMIAALTVSIPGFMLAKRRTRPLLAAKSLWPTKTHIDQPLIIGAVLFGIGWGLVGLCPGPALENLSTLSPRIIVFVASMAGGVLLQNIWHRSRPMAQREAELANVADG
jgi:uncharacterized protein